MAYVRDGLAAGEESVVGLAGAYEAGELSAEDWQQAMRNEIKGEYLRQYMLGRGGRNAMTARDWGIVGSQIKEQYQFLRDFAGQVAAGALAAGQITTRAKMYVRSAREGFERARAEAIGNIRLPAYPGDGSTRCLTNCKCNWRLVKRIEGGVLIGVDAFWELSPAEHCEDCLLRASRWSPLFVPVVGRSITLPTGYVMDINDLEKV